MQAPEATLFFIFLPDSFLDRREKKKSLLQTFLSIMAPNFGLEINFRSGLVLSFYDENVLSFIS